MKKISTLIIVFVALLVSQAGFSQTVYRSLSSGQWGTFGTWERSTNGGATWTPAISGQLPTTNTSVIIQSGHVITIEASGKSCVNLTINSGAQLTCGSNAFSLRVGAGSSGTAGVTGVLLNNGILGSVGGDQMVLELPAPCDTMTVTGTGLTNIGRIRNITTNSNNPGSVTANHTDDARLYVDQNIVLNTANNYCFSMPNSAVATSDVMIYTINAGRTVTVTSPTSKWENSLMSTGGAINGGSYTYNIDGTLDLTATTATSAFIPYANASSAINVNINGTVKLGTAFKADTVDGSFGAISLKINNGGLLDASLTTSFNVGKTGTSANTTNGNIFWVVAGNGSIRRTAPADGSKISFPIGTSITSYTPASVSRDASAGTSAVFTVGIQNTFDNAPADPTKVVNRQWNITAPTGGPLDTLRLSWTTAEQAGSFDPAGSVAIMHWTGAAWEYKTASVSGSGTSADPYVAKAYGFTSFSPFGVANFAPIPVSLLSFNASYNGQKVNLNWNTTNEINSKLFEIERSNDGVNYSSVGTVAAKNSAGNNSYSFADMLPLVGGSFYRLKIVDIDGRFKYSNVISLNTKVKAGLSVYPSPAVNTITISHGKLAESAVIKIVGTDGRLIMSNKVVAGAVQTTIDVSKLTRGTYQVIALDGTNKNSVGFMKQ